MKKKPITAPNGLTRSGLAFWRRLKSSLDESGNLDSTDTHVLTLAAKAYEEYEQARNDVLKNGVTLRTTSERGYEIIKSNPSAPVMGQASTRLLRCLNQLGLTPAARGRSRGGSGSALGDPIGDLLEDS